MASWAINPALAQVGGSPYGLDCRASAFMAEQEANLPPGLLYAIGRVETGRANPQTGRVEPWAWSTNMAGISHYFDTAGEAIGWTASQLAAGQRSIDVGCFQINLMHHPDAFTTLEEAFDPAANARYAARFLISLYRRTGSWQAAAAQYHSVDPARGGPYGDRVFALLAGGELPARPVTSIAFRTLADRAWMAIGPAAYGIQVFIPSASASALPTKVALPDVRSVPPPSAERLFSRAGEVGLPKVYTPGMGN